MLNALLKVLTLCLVISVQVVQADESPVLMRNPAAETDDSDIVVRKKSPNSLFVGLDLRSYKYDEPGFVTHTGMLYGVWFEYITNSSIGLIGTKGTILYGGNLKYDGALCDSLGNCTPYSTEQQKDIIANANFDYFIKTNTNFTYKIGAGYRYLYDSVSETGFYQRTGAWIYLPIGVLIDANLQANMKLQFDLAYSFIVYGGIKSNLSEVSSQYSDIYLSQTGNGLNFSANLIMQKAYKVGLYYESWNLNESGFGTTGGLTVVEPKNNSASYGVRFGYDFF